MAPPTKPGPKSSKRTSMDMEDCQILEKENSPPLAKKVKNHPLKSENEIKKEVTILGPHVIKVMDKEMLDRVRQKYEKMGHSVQMKDNIIKLNQIKSETCLQEEVCKQKLQ